MHTVTVLGRCGKTVRQRDTGRDKERYRQTITVGQKRQKQSINRLVYNVIIDVYPLLRIALFRLM